MSSTSSTQPAPAQPPTAPPATTLREPLLTGPFVLAAAAHFLHALAFNLYLHLSSFLKTAGASERTIGLIFGITGAAAILTRPPLGRIMDQRGRRVIIRAGGLLHACVCLLYGTVHVIGPWVVCVRIAHGISEAMIFMSLFAFASDIVPASRRFEGIALFGVSGMLPISIGSVLGDVILEHAGYRELFATSAVLALAAFLLSLPLAEPVRKPGGEPARGMLAAFRQRDLVPLWLGGTVFATCITGPFTFFATFVLQEKVGSTGLFFSCYAIAAICLRIFAGKLPERLGAKRVLFPAMAAVAAGLVILVFARTPTTIALAGILSGMGHGYTFPILLGLLVSRARPADRGASLAIFTALFDAGALLGNPLFGAIVKSAGYRTMFGVAAAMMVLGTAAFARLDRGRS